MAVSSSRIEFSAADLYGQLHPVETPKMIEIALANLESELSKIPDNEKQSYLRATKECPELVNDSHKLMFLRCEVFNADLAAYRLVQYWKKRLQLFGEIKAYQPFSLATTYKDEVNFLKLGFLRLMPAKDITGRAIIFSDPSKQDKKCNREMMVRATWYIFHAALEETSVQQKGVVIILYYKKLKYKDTDRIQLKMILDSLGGCLPVRISAFHVIHPPTFVKVVFPFIKLQLAPKIRKRVLFHTGSCEKILKRLKQFHLVPAYFPVDIGGKVIIDQNGWIEKRLAVGK